MIKLIDGRFAREDSLAFIPVGVNYHPTSVGCRLWKKWDPVQIEKDMKKISTLGFNTVRFFLFWEDFEPKEGIYSEKALANLKNFVGIASRYKVFLIPTLFTGWMSGGKFEPSWKGQRHMLSDHNMLEAEVRHVTRIAETLKDMDNIHSIDLSNEPASLIADDTDRGKISFRYIERWTERLTQAIKSVDPNRLVTVGTDHTSCVCDNGFRYDALKVDYLCVHGYPLWSPFVMESLISFRSTYYIPFMIKFASAYKPTLVEEFGFFSDLADNEKIANYFRVVLASAWANGAVGFLAWCWQDFKTKEHPYELLPMERHSGIVDIKYRVKSQGSVIREFLHDLKDIPIPSKKPAKVALYITNSYYSNEQYAMWKDTGNAAIGYFHAYLLLKRLHIRFEITRQIKPHHKLVIIPSAINIYTSEIELLKEHTKGGGVVYLSIGDYTLGYLSLFGAKADDFRLLVKDDYFNFLGSTFRLPKQDGKFPVIKEAGCEVLSSFESGSPAFVRYNLGAGKVFLLNAPLERDMNLPYLFNERTSVTNELENEPESSNQTDFCSIYNFIIREAGIIPFVDISARQVETELMEGDKIFLINHSGKEKIIKVGNKKVILEGYSYKVTNKMGS